MDDLQLTATLRKMQTDTGRTVLDLSYDQPVMLIFLRHFGCTFCREALSDIAELRPQIEADGTRVVFVHMADNELAGRYFKKYKLHGACHVSDPDCEFYQFFGLTKGTSHQLFGLHSWVRGFEAGVMNGHGVGYRPLGDGFQMPGVFVLLNGEIRESFVHKLASDRPDYASLSRCCKV